ncbi:hypothetical protein WICPIJ_001396 [Wickerhamomyces pijperi]|uniref:Uncharacterized protein n=1 Tax=Wickerhamomyces pijperi TaxID=599730 RepID=A0A9P8TQL6_WICPI|nr:hypothetical protein WICPIJ_001396 [Wickerhamomyces pijperi]
MISTIKGNLPTILLLTSTFLNNFVLAAQLDLTEQQTLLPHRTTNYSTHTINNVSELNDSVSQESDTDLNTEDLIWGEDSGDADENAQAHDFPSLDLVFNPSDDYSFDDPANSDELNHNLENEQPSTSQLQQSCKPFKPIPYFKPTKDQAKSFRSLYDSLIKGTYLHKQKLHSSITEMYGYAYVLNKLDSLIPGLFLKCIKSKFAKISNDSTSLSNLQRINYDASKLSKKGTNSQTLAFIEKQPLCSNSKPRHINMISKADYKYMTGIGNYFTFEIDLNEQSTDPNKIFHMGYTMLLSYCESKDHLDLQIALILTPEVKAEHVNNAGINDEDYLSELVALVQCRDEVQYTVTGTRADIWRSTTEV